MLDAYRYRSRLEKLIRQWTDYRGLVLTRLGAPDVKASEERNFLSLKGQIAEGLAVLTGKLGQTAAQDAHSHVRAMNALLNRYPTLYADQALAGKAREEFEREWHDHFLFFNKLKGMKGAQDDEERVPGRPAPAFAAPESIHRGTGGSRFTTVLLRILLLVVIAVVLVRFIPWNTLVGPYSRNSSGGGVAGFFDGIWTSIKETWQGISTGSVGFLEPVASRYGPEATLVLVAVLLIGLGYFIFVRMR